MKCKGCRVRRSFSCVHRIIRTLPKNQPAWAFSSRCAIRRFPKRESFLFEIIIILFLAWHRFFIVREYLLLYVQGAMFMSRDKYPEKSKDMPVTQEMFYELGNELLSLLKMYAVSRGY